MPPWKAGPGDYEFRDERHLSETEIAAIREWVEEGMPEGDPRKLPSMPTFTEGWQLGRPDLVVSMTEAFPVPAYGRDIYRNFVLPLNLTEDRWVSAIDFRPSARTVVHHSLFFLDGTGAARAAQEAAAKDERDGLISSLTAFVPHTADGCPHNFFASYAFISFERIDNSVNITTGFYFEMVSWESTGIAT